jgi:hypothetical protein
LFQIASNFRPLSWPACLASKLGLAQALALELMQKQRASIKKQANPLV